MKPTSNQPMQLTKLLDELEDKLSKIEGKNSSDSRTEKTQEKNQKAASGSSSSVSVPITPRLASGTKSAEKAALTFDGSKVNGDPHTTPIKRAKPVRQINIKTEVIRRSKKSSDEEKSSSSTTPRSVRFTTSDTNTPVSHRSVAPTPTSTPMPTPAATPRTAVVANDDSSSGSSGRGRPVSPRAKELRKKISKGFSKAAINIGKFGEKLASQVSSISTSTLATPKSSGRSSPKNSSPQKEDVLSFLTIKEKNDIAIAINKFEAELDDDLSTARKKMLRHAKLMELVPDRTKLTNLSVLDVLMADVKKRYSVAFIDKEIDLGDPQYLDWVNGAADGAFIKTWDKDNATVDNSELKKYLEFVQPSFARDFKFSSYEIKNSDGLIKKLNSIDEFMEFIGPGSEGNLPKVVSNIASQNLGMFLKPVLFYREQKGKIPESVLHLDDGTPIRPSVNFRQKYTFSKNSDGKIIIDYESNASKEFQNAKPMMVSKNSGGLAIDVNDATIKIKVLIEVNPDGRWYINNPHVVAENWNNVVG
ncbi:hypothetical protein MCEMSE6_00474 [Oxalobacteraceae bacterium]